ncbi:MAG: response regulator [Candidatus Gastranaerophilales bacterium]|nr:response regulator [Candidatus Gastranaerophilales bacterium]
MVKILIVDDSTFMRTSLKEILTPQGHEIIGEAANGNQAVELYKTLSPDIVTMDITMPECDGLTALKKIVEMDKNAKVIMCTAMGQQAMVMEAVKAGAKDFIVKPFKVDKVLQSIAKCAA